MRLSMQIRSKWTMTDYNETSTTTKFDDMCEDVIDMILCCLKLEDLANVSDTSRRLRSIAGSVFSRNHTNQLVSIDCFDPSDEMGRADIYVIYKDKPVVRIADAKVWFRLLRNFGSFIKYIRIHMRCKDEMNIRTSWKKMCTIMSSNIAPISWKYLNSTDIHIWIWINHYQNFKHFSEMLVQCLKQWNWCRIWIIWAYGEFHKHWICVFRNWKK